MAMAARVGVAEKSMATAQNTIAAENVRSQFLAVQAVRKSGFVMRFFICKYFKVIKTSQIYRWNRLHQLHQSHKLSCQLVIVSRCLLFAVHIVFSDTTPEDGKHRHSTQPGQIA
jgi:hypothetical protein